MKKTLKLEFLTKEEIEYINSRCDNLNPRQFKVLDLMKSWQTSTADDNGQFTLAIKQISDELKVSKKTVERDLTKLIAQRLLTKTKTRAKALNYRVNNWSLFETKNTKMSHETNYETNYMQNTETQLVNAKMSHETNQGTNDTEMSHSNSNSYSKSNSKVAGNYNNSKSISTVSTTGVTNATFGEIENYNKNFSNSNMNNITFTFPTFTVEYYFNSIDELDAITTKVEEIAKRFNITTGVTNATNVSKSIVGFGANTESYAEEKPSEEKNIVNTGTTKTTSATNATCEEIGKLWCSMDKAVKEIHDLPLADTTALLCASGNKYANILNHAREFADTNAARLSKKQLLVMNDKLDKLEKTINDKKNNCRLYAGKTAHDVAISKVQILCRKLSESETAELFNERCLKFNDWITTEMTKGNLTDADAPTIGDYFRIASDKFNAAHAVNASENTPESFKSPEADNVPEREEKRGTEEILATVADASKTVIGEVAENALESFKIPEVDNVPEQVGNRGTGYENEEIKRVTVQASDYDFDYDEKINELFPLSLDDDSTESTENTLESFKLSEVDNVPGTAKRTLRTIEIDESGDDWWECFKAEAPDVCVDAA